MEKEQGSANQAKGRTLLRVAEPDKTSACSFLVSMLRKESAVYAYMVDTFSEITFYTPLGMASEIWMAGMSFGQSLKTRVMGAITGAIFGRPYGKFRDYVFKKTKTGHSSSSLRKMAVDTAALITFWMPVYFGQLYIAGASKKSIIVALAIAIPFSFVEGRPFGMYMDWIRKKAGLRPAADGFRT